jgi:hypothetical protein
LGSRPNDHWSYRHNMSFAWGFPNHQTEHWSHQLAMAEISQFMWKWPRPEFEFQGHSFDMSNFVYTRWKAFPCHSRIYKTRLNPSIIDWVRPLKKWSNFPLWPTFWGHRRDDLEGWILHFLKCLVEGNLWAKNDVSNLSGSNRDSHTHIHSYDNITALRLRRACKSQFWVFWGKLLTKLLESKSRNL